MGLRDLAFFICLAPRSAALLPLIGLHPLVEPFSAHELPATHRNVREPRNPRHLASENVGDVGLGAAEDGCHVVDSQDRCVFLRLLA